MSDHSPFYAEVMALSQERAEYVIKTNLHGLRRLLVEQGPIWSLHGMIPSGNYYCYIVTASKPGMDEALMRFVYEAVQCENLLAQVEVEGL